MEKGSDIAQIGFMKRNTERDYTYVAKKVNGLELSMIDIYVTTYSTTLDYSLISRKFIKGSLNDTKTRLTAGDYLFEGDQAFFICDISAQEYDFIMNPKRFDDDNLFEKILVPSYKGDTNLNIDNNEAKKRLDNDLSSIVNLDALRSVGYNEKFIAENLRRYNDNPELREKGYQITILNKIASLKKPEILNMTINEQNRGSGNHRGFWVSYF